MTGKEEEVTVMGETWKDHVISSVYLALCAAFNLSPASEESLARFVRAYTDNSTNPQADRNRNICYIYASLIQGTGFDYVMSRLNENGSLVIEKTIPVEVTLYFYGPNAYSDAEYFWSIFNVDYGRMSPRAILRRKQIVPLVDHPGATPDRPVTLTEDEGTYKRDRADLRLQLEYYEVSYPDLEVGTAENIPEIIAIENEPALE